MGGGILYFGGFRGRVGVGGGGYLGVLGWEVGRVRGGRWGVLRGTGVGGGGYPTHPYRRLL